MAEQDKTLLLHKIDGTLRTRMYANLLEETEDEIQNHLDEFDVTHIGNEEVESEDLLDTYINAKRVSGRSELTLVRYRYTIERFMQYVNVKTREVNQHHVRDYFAHEKRRGIQDSTIEGTREVLNSYFGWLEHEKMIPSNPVFNVEPIKCQIKERNALSASEIEILKRNCKNIRDNAIISFLLATGCRISELVGLNVDDVDLVNGECIVLGKGNKERTVFLDEVALLTLKEYLARRNDDCEALFVNKRHGRLLPGGIRCMLKTLAEKANVDHVHPHRFRRTNVTHLLNRGMPIQEVAILAGHSKIDTTMKYFAANKARIKNSYRMYTE